MVLADATTSLLHGADCLESIKATAASVFAGKADADNSDLPREVVPSAELDAGKPVVDILIELCFAKSKGEARRLIKGGGARLNNVKVGDEEATIGEEDVIEGRVLLLAAGKKNKLLVRVV